MKFLDSCNNLHDCLSSFPLVFARLNKHDTTAKMLYFAIVEFQRVLSSMSYHQQYKTYCESGIKTTPGRNRLRAPIHALGKPEAEKIIDYTSLNKLDLM
jgi:hypothetical protein